MFRDGLVRMIRGVVKDGVGGGMGGFLGWDGRLYRVDAACVVFSGKEEGCRV